MNKLISLEMKKYGKGSVFKAVSKIWIPLIFSIAFLGMFLFFEKMPMLTNLSIEEFGDFIRDISEMPPVYSLYFQMVSVIGLIFTSIMYSAYVVKDFKTKKIQQLYLYPIKKSKILLSKILTAFIISFLSMIVTTAMGILLILILNKGPIPTIEYVNQIQNIILIPVVGLIPMVIGMKKKSVVSTIVSGVVISLLLGGNLGTISLWDYSIVNIILSIIGVVLTVWIIRDPMTTECFNRGENK